MFKCWRGFWEACIRHNTFPGFLRSETRMATTCHMKHSFPIPLSSIYMVELMISVCFQPPKNITTCIVLHFIHMWLVWFLVSHLQCIISLWKRCVYVSFEWMLHHKIYEFSPFLVVYKEKKACNSHYSQTHRILHTYTVAIFTKRPCITFDHMNLLQAIAS